jgi:hypothetical protein
VIGIVTTATVGCADTCAYGETEMTEAHFVSLGAHEAAKDLIREGEVYVIRGIQQTDKSKKVGRRRYTVIAQRLAHREESVEVKD